MGAVKKSEDQELRDCGYMTPNDFVDKLVPGLKEYLNKNWGMVPNRLYHPEDLASNVAIYMEVAYHVLVDFGARPPR